MTVSEIAALLGLNLGLIAVAMLALWTWVVRSRDVGLVDVAWPLGMLLVALATFARTDGDPVRKGLLLWLCAIWALRLAWRRFKLWRRRDESDRYDATIDGGAARGWSFGKTSLLMILWPQAALAWLTALPVQLGQMQPAPMGWIGWGGATLVVIGIAMENISNAQRSAFERNPANAGRVLDTGLWRYSRRPNDFGDACVWWGLWLIAAETGWIGAVSIVGPAFFTLLLTRWACREAPDPASAAHAAYVQRTSAFFPLPPKAV